MVQGKVTFKIISREVCSNDNTFDFDLHATLLKLDPKPLSLRHDVSPHIFKYKLRLEFRFDFLCYFYDRIVKLHPKKSHVMQTQKWLNLVTSYFPFVYDKFNSVKFQIPYPDVFFKSVM